MGLHVDIHYRVRVSFTKEFLDAVRSCRIDRFSSLHIVCALRYEYVAMLWVARIYMYVFARAYMCMIVLVASRSLYTEVSNIC